MHLTDSGGAVPAPGFASTCVALGLAVCFWTVPATAQEIPTAADVPALPAPTQNAQAGAAVFGAKGCVRCHTVSGEGGALGPDLRQIAHERTFQELAADIWNHLPGMTRRMADLGIERPRLSAREAGDLVAYIYSLDYFEPPGDAVRGRKLFRDRQCIRCHRVGGVGGVVGPDLDFVGARGAPIEVATAMWNHGPAMTAAAERRGIPRPFLTGRDLTDLLAYLKSVAPDVDDLDIHVLPGRAEAGQALLETRRCAECHGQPGAGGGIAPDLARLARGASLTDFMAAMWNKAPVMLQALEGRGLPFPQLSSAELADLVAYLYSVDYFAGAGSARRGRNLVPAKGCLGCHTIGDRGAGEAPDLASVPGLSDPATLLAGLWNHRADVGMDQNAGGAAWPTFSAAEMADLIAYLQAVNR